MPVKRDSIFNHLIIAFECYAVVPTSSTLILLRRANSTDSEVGKSCICDLIYP
jgi:hypothetical protein